MPISFQPMPLSRRPRPFNHPEWLFELKYDGFRALARVNEKERSSSRETVIRLQRFRILPIPFGIYFRAAMLWCWMARLCVSIEWDAHNSMTCLSGEVVPASLRLIHGSAEVSINKEIATGSDSS